MLHTRIKEIYALCINKCIYIYKNTTIFNIFYMKYWKNKKKWYTKFKNSHQYKGSERGKQYVEI